MNPYNILSKSAKNGINGLSLTPDERNYILQWSKWMDNRTGDLKSVYKNLSSQPGAYPIVAAGGGGNNAIIPGINWTYGNPNAGNNYALSPAPSIISNNPGDFNTAPNVIDVDFTDVTNPTAPVTATETATGGKLGNLKNWFSGLGLANSGWNLTGNSRLGVGNTGGKAGLVVGGKNLGRLGVGVGLGIDAVKSVKSIADQNDINTDSENLINNIKASAAGNPMLSSYLTSDQMDTLGKIKRGAYKSDSKASMFNSGMLSGGLKGALSGLVMGGLPGAALGAIGGGITGGLNNKTSQLQGNNTELSNLYQSLQDAEAQYKRMRIPNFTGLGLQSRYTNQWI